MNAILFEPKSEVEIKKPPSLFITVRLHPGVEASAAVLSILSMGTVLEIKQAIETLPREQRQELREWFLERDAVISASASVFGLYDAEEWEGQQWQD